MKEFGFPGDDYLIHAPRAHNLCFTKTPARWGDAVRGIHAALVDVGVPVRGDYPHLAFFQSFASDCGAPITDP